MKRFKAKLHGENFLLNFDGEFKKFGFYATKFVKAKNPQEAEKNCCHLNSSKSYLKKYHIE
jgi:hypothetical protein